MLLGLLRDADDDAGRARPTRADAWAVRIQGSAERLTPTSGWAASTAGALASLFVVVNVFALLGRTSQLPTTAWQLVLDPAALVPLAATAAAPALVSLGGVALLRSTRVVSDPAAVLSAAAACAAWTLGAVVSGLAGVDLHRADADLAASPTSAATFPLLAVALTLGTVAAATAWDGTLAVVPTLRDAPGRAGPRSLARRVVATALGAPTALCLGLGAMAPGVVFLGGTAVATACLLRSRRTPTAGERAPTRRRPPLVADGRRASAAGQLAVAGLMLGAVGVVQLALGPAGRKALVADGVLLAGPRPFTDGTLVSGLGAALTAVAVGLVLLPRWTRWTHLAVGASCAALLLPSLVAAGGALVVADGDAGPWPHLGGGLLVGLAAAAPLRRVLPGGVVARWTTSALVGTGAGLTFGAGLVATAPLLTPLAAGAVLVSLLVSAARVRRPAPGPGRGPATAGPAART